MILSADSYPAGCQKIGRQLEISELVKRLKVGRLSVNWLIVLFCNRSLLWSQ